MANYLFNEDSALRFSLSVFFLHHISNATNFHQLMANLTKRDLVIKISNDTGMIQQDVLSVIQKTLDHIIASLQKGKTVELRNFGVFEVNLRKARVGRNPNKPETDVPIPPRAIVKFKAGKEMKATVLKLSSDMIKTKKSSS